MSSNLRIRILKIQTDLGLNPSSITSVALDTCLNSPSLNFLIWERGMIKKQLYKVVVKIKMDKECQAVNMGPSMC